MHICEGKVLGCFLTLHSFFPIVLEGVYDFWLVLHCWCKLSSTSHWVKAPIKRCWMKPDGVLNRNGWVCVRFGLHWWLNRWQFNLQTCQSFCSAQNVLKLQEMQVTSATLCWQVQSSFLAQIVCNFVKTILNDAFLLAYWKVKFEISFNTHCADTFTAEASFSRGSQGPFSCLPLIKIQQRESPKNTLRTLINGVSEYDIISYNSSLIINISWFCQ